MTYRASGRKSASARRPVGHFTSKECAMNLGINAISLQPLSLYDGVSGNPHAKGLDMKVFRGFPSAKFRRAGQFAVFIRCRRWA